MYYVEIQEEGGKVNNKLKEIREARGLSQLKLSFLTGLQPADISRIENGWIRPYPSWRKRLAKALGTSQVELFPDEKNV